MLCEVLSTSEENLFLSLRLISTLSANPVLCSHGHLSTAIPQPQINTTQFSCLLYLA